MFSCKVPGQGLLRVGATAPLGFFDPLGFCPLGDEANFRALRFKELKHGRVAMLASLGGVFEHYGRFPFLGFNEQQGGITDRMFEKPGTWAFQILVIMCAVVELGIWKEDPDREPGDFGDPAGFTKVFPYDEDMRNRELNNGRMAMFTAVGILAAEAFTGKDAVQQFGF
ncbi:unnamed protein product [Prorocentrum cordatum]|uniref:Chlorophyll a-b binding protein, chloroplastic n=1 Tax=Prorocentrum cordatum TaxID=2364126 RepID=A0ABN9XUX9_9DINO|nr:unnamed protein product [Polarella glacialis]